MVNKIGTVISGKNDMKIRVIGAGLAGCEAAWQAARAGVFVELYEMKPKRYTPAHQSPYFAELVCSNSLRSDRLENAAGLLKEEMRKLDSLLLACADASCVPAGGALAVDRDIFSGRVTEKIRENPKICVKEEEVERIPEDGITVIATGPLTQGNLYVEIEKKIRKGTLHFFDAAAPIVTADSIDRNIVFAMSRYNKGGADYLNCPMDKPEYEAFWEALVTAELAEVEEFDSKAVFEGCMPIETMAKRGKDTIRFGPLKPVGLIDPRTEREPYACVQLRQDDKNASMYNIVGFQTRLRFPEQKRVFRMIPGLQDAEFSRMGVMHRNTYLHSPGIINRDYSLISDSNLFFAGQMTGVEGYVESIASGFTAGFFAAMRAREIKNIPFFPDTTMIGAMSAYISDAKVKHFQPMNANFGLLPPLDQKIKNKKDRYIAFSRRALQDIEASSRVLTASLFSSYEK